VIVRLAHPSLGRFLLVGCSAAVLNLGLLWLFTSILGIWYLASSVAAYCISVGYNFVLQRLWAFGGIAGAIGSQLSYFILINLSGVALNTMIVFLLVEELGVWYVVAQTAASLIIAVQSFFGYRWIFRVEPRACS
jgi:putative flippase GtrA